MRKTNLRTVWTALISFGLTLRCYAFASIVTIYASRVRDFDQSALWSGARCHHLAIFNHIASARHVSRTCLFFLKFLTVYFNWRTLSIVDLDGDLCLESWVFTTFYNTSPRLIIYLPESDGNMLKMKRLFTSNPGHPIARFTLGLRTWSRALAVYRQKHWALLHSDTNLYQLTGGNWQKWKRVFLTCPCHKFYRDEAVGLSLLSRLSFLFVKNIVLAPSWWNGRFCFAKPLTPPAKDSLRSSFASGGLSRLRRSIFALRARGLFISDRVKPSLWQRLSWSKKLKKYSKNYDICENVKFGAISWKIDILSITA